MLFKIALLILPVFLLIAAGFISSYLKFLKKNIVDNLAKFFQDFGIPFLLFFFYLRLFPSYLPKHIIEKSPSSHPNNHIRTIIIDKSSSSLNHHRNIIIKNYHPKSSSTTIIQHYHSKSSSKIIIKNHHQKSSSPNPHLKSSLKTIINKSSSKIIIKNDHQKSSSQSNI